MAARTDATAVSTSSALYGVDRAGRSAPSSYTSSASTPITAKPVAGKCTATPVWATNTESRVNAARAGSAWGDAAPTFQPAIAPRSRTTMSCTAYASAALRGHSATGRSNGRGMRPWRAMVSTAAQAWGSKAVSGMGSILGW
ncbi:hypothetical protein D3C72_1759520 [compost metagenome]